MVQMHRKRTHYTVGSLEGRYLRGRSTLKPRCRLGAATNDQGFKAATMGNGPCDPVFAQIEASQDQYIARLAEAVAIPSVSGDKSYRKDVFRMADWLESELKKLNVQYAQVPEDANASLADIWRQDRKAAAGQADAGRRTD